MPRNGSLDTGILPAYDTKHLKTLHYDLVLPTIPKQEVKLELQQDDTAGSTTGTTLWLGGQVLAAYLISLKRPTSKNGLKPKAMDLGSGIGYTSLLLTAAGYDVTATDLPILTEGVLAANLTSNKQHLVQVPASGSVQCVPLDWMTATEEWSPALRNNTYDLIISSDSIYQQALVNPLLQTIYSLCTSGSPEKMSNPDIYIAYEHRDDAQYTSFTRQAEDMGFKVKIAPKGKVGKAVSSLYGWSSEVYEGITVLSLKLQNDKGNA